MCTRVVFSFIFISFGFWYSMCAALPSADETFAEARQSMGWKELDARLLLSSLNNTPSAVPANCVVRKTAVAASTLLRPPVPVYVSIATISSRIQDVSLLVCDLLAGSVVPDRIFVLSSPEPFLLDSGVSPLAMPPSLLALAAKHHHPHTHNIHSGRNTNTTRVYSNANDASGVTVDITLVQTDHMLGPHRKLLPLLSRKWVWNKDVAILTMDDDIRVASSYLQQFVLRDAEGGGRSITAGTVRRIGVGLSGNGGVTLLPYKHWAQVHSCRGEVLVLPVGRGSVLYRPRFFHPVVFDSALRTLTATNDDLTFRLATLVNAVPVILLAPSQGLRTDLNSSLSSATTGLFRQRNRQARANNYSNVAQWRAGVGRVQSLGLLDHSSLAERVLVERGGACSSPLLQVLAKAGAAACVNVMPKQCALQWVCPPEDEEELAAESASSSSSRSLGAQVALFYAATVLLLLWLFRHKVWPLISQHGLGGGR